MLYLVIGRRELGKTTLAMRMANTLPRRAILDPRNMIHPPGADRIHDANDAFEAVADMLDGYTRDVVLWPHDDDDEQTFDTWARALKSAALEFPRATWAVVIDEASFYRLDSKPFQWLVKCTPRDKVHIIITAHRPQDIPTRLQAIADEWCIFASTQEHDLRQIRDRSPELAARVERLQGREFAHWNDALKEMKVNANPQSWRYDLAPALPAEDV